MESGRVGGMVSEGTFRTRASRDEGIAECMQCASWQADKVEWSDYYSTHANINTPNKCFHSFLTPPQTLLTAVKAALLAPVPRVYQDVAHSEPESPPGSPAGATGTLAKLEGHTRAHPCGERVTLAGDVDAESLMTTEATARTAMQRDVIEPLEAWIEAYHKMKEQEKEVEAQRLEVDSRRRTVADLTVKEAKEQAAVQRSQDAKHTQRLEDARATLKHKTEKLDMTVARFNELESTLHANLVALAQDTVHLRTYLSNALRMRGELMLKLAEEINGELASVSTELPGQVLPLQGGAAASPASSRGYPEVAPASPAAVPATQEHATQPTVPATQEYATQPASPVAQSPVAATIATPGEHFAPSGEEFIKPGRLENSQPGTPTAAGEPTYVRTNSPLQQETSRLANVNLA